MVYLFLIIAVVTAVSFIVAIVMGLFGYWDEAWPIKTIGQVGAVVLSLISYLLATS